MALFNPMARPAVRSPLRFDGDPGARTLMLIAITAAFFASAAILVAATSTDLVKQWRWAFDGTVTVQIPPTGDPEADTARAASLATALTGMAQVDRARALGPREVARMVEPWLGSLEAEDTALPLPRLIDVRLLASTETDLKILERRIQTLVPEAVLDDHGRWVRGLGRLAFTVETVAILVLGLVTTAVILAVGLSVRTALALHRETVDILHMMGAEDGYIAGLFAGLAFRQALSGGLIGVTLTVIVTLAAGQVSAGAGAVLPSLTVGLTGWIATLSIPLLLAIVAWVVGRLSALAALRRVV